MKNPKITRKITQGVYVLTTVGGGCIVDAVSRASAGEQPLITVAVAKTNHSHKLLSENDRFALSVLGEDVDPEIIETFGFKSSKDIDKCTECETTEIEGVPVVKNSLGYMVCEKVDAIDAETHTIYIGRMVEADVLEDKTPMTYAYYQEHKSDLMKVKTEQNKTAWVCTACGYVYYGDEVPDDYKCPLCGLGKDYFKKKSD
jgi:flavin reductase (DIM6/NTAB) family NADH-FMN oxidoreductase RutF